MLSQRSDHARGSARCGRSGAPHARARFVLATVLVLGALLAVALFVALVTGIETCGGDGGSPYAAPASPRGKYCESQLPWISLVGGLALTGLGGALAAGHRRWRPLVTCAVIGGALVVSPLVLGSALPKDCEDNKGRSECAHY